MSEFTPAPPLPQAPPPPAKKSKVWLIIVIILLVLCCCCVVIGIVGYQYGDQIFQPIIESLENSGSSLLTLGYA